MKNNRKIPISLILPAGIILVVVILFVSLLFAMRGENITVGAWPETESTDSLSCSSNNVEYPFFKYDNSTKKKMEVSMIFENSILKSTSLLYVLYYPNVEEVNRSNAINQNAMGRNMGENGFSTTAFNINYQILADSLQMSLFMKSDEITDESSKYLLLDSIDTRGLTKTALKNAYSNKGFACTNNK